jgi:hypothetical protein
MRKFLVCGVLIAGAAIAFTSQSCKGSSESVSGTCASFCKELVNAMDDSDYYDLSHEGVSGTKKSCGQDCTEVVTEYNALDIGDMDECVSCIADKGFNQIGTAATDVSTSSHWTLGVLPMDILGTTGTDCASKCDRTDIEYTNQDGILIDEFLTDFFTDFVEHYSDAEPLCEDYNGDNLCCKESNPCFLLDSNGVCNCDDACSWDTYDCSGGTDVDTDTDTDTSTDTTYCAGYTGTNDCCTDADPCGYTEDGVCDCDGMCWWDTVDCGA